MPGIEHRKPYLLYFRVSYRTRLSFDVDDVQLDFRPTPENELDSRSTYIPDKRARFSFDIHDVELDSGSMYLTDVELDSRSMPMTSSSILVTIFMTDPKVSVR